MKKHFMSSAFIVLLAAAAVMCAQQPSLTIHLDQPTAKVSPLLYGLMTEEINYSYDGGLYAELVADRTIGTGFHALRHWTMVAKGSSLSNVSLDEKTGPSDATHRSIKVEVKEASASSPAGVQNDGFWGIPVRSNTTYTGTIYAKASGSVPLTISLVNDETGIASASTVVSGLADDWKQYSFTLKTGNAEVSSNNHLQLTVTQPVTLWLGYASLFPPTYRNRANGNRVDLMEKLAAMHPKFLRFPGGNYLEGDHIGERFDWKKTIGPMIDRPTHRSPWNYRSSDGMGLLEFLEWCEDLNMEPVLAVYAGYSLAQEHVAPGSDLQPYVLDAMEEIEYVTGGADTKWGAQRVKDGHPAPFALRYVEIGNEDEFDKSKSYDGRFAQFYKAIKDRYPSLQLIATTPVQSVQADVIDEHYYMAAEKSFSEAHHYDNTDRNSTKVFVGEWATREGTPTPNLQSALGDATWMTGMERNSDIVIMASYAPLFVNMNPGGMQWESDLIGYDVLNSYGSPSYWAQQMFASHIGDEIVKSELSNAGPRVFGSVTRDTKQHKLILKLVNATSEQQNVSLVLEGVTNLKIKPEACLITLSGKTPNATNTLRRPDAVIPVETMVKVSAPKMRQLLVPYSVNVLEISYM